MTDTNTSRPPRGVSFVPITRPRESDETQGTCAQLPLTDRLEAVVELWAKSQYELVTLAAEFADRRRRPTRRQRRLVKERDQTCTDCGRAELLQYDHVPAHKETGHTITTELKLRCAPCHTKRHRRGS